MVPPSIDLKNRDLVESHLNAEWLASLGMELKADNTELDKDIKANLDLTDPAKSLLPEIRPCGQRGFPLRRDHDSRLENGSQPWTGTS